MSIATRTAIIELFRIFVTVLSTGLITIDASGIKALLGAWLSHSFRCLTVLEWWHP